MVMSKDFPQKPKPDERCPFCGCDVTIKVIEEINWAKHPRADCWVSETLTLLSEWNTRPIQRELEARLMRGMANA